MSVVRSQYSLNSSDWAATLKRARADCAANSAQAASAPRQVWGSARSNSGAVARSSLKGGSSNSGAVTKSLKGGSRSKRGMQAGKGGYQPPGNVVAMSSFWSRSSTDIGSGGVRQCGQFTYSDQGVPQYGKRRVWDNMGGGADNDMRPGEIVPQDYFTPSTKQFVTSKKEDSQVKEIVFGTTVYKKSGYEI
jgi:hypothetical protein